MSNERSCITWFILILQRVVDSMLPCGTSCFFFCFFFKSDRVDPMRTWKVLSVKKFLIYFGSLPLSLRSYRSFMTPNFHVVS